MGELILSAQGAGHSVWCREGRGHRVLATVSGVGRGTQSAGHSVWCREGGTECWPQCLV